MHNCQQYLIEILDSDGAIHLECFVCEKYFSRVTYAD